MIVSWGEYGGGRYRRGIERLSYAVLGPLEVRREGGVVPFRGRLQRRLLTALISAAGRTITPDRLVELVWGDDPPTTPRQALKLAVSRLRTQLGVVVPFDGGGYRLVVDDAQVDRAVFERLLTEARSAAPTQALRLLEGALSLWRGCPLDDLADDLTIGAEVSRLEEALADVVDRRAAALLALGRYEEAVIELRAACSSAPLREHRVELLMLALYHNGSQADALRAYDAFRERLVTELGVEPTPRLRSVHVSVLKQAVPEWSDLSDRNRSAPPRALVGRDPELDDLLDTVLA